MSGVRCVAPVGDITGEGVVWSADEGAVYWTDINRFLIHRMNGDGSVASWYFDEPVTALGLTDRPGTLIAALASRLILWWPRDDWRETLGSTLADWPEVRFNDGRPDPLGGFVVGTMGNNVGSDGEGLPVVPGIGKLFRFTPEGGFATIQEGIGISNTICWSPDHTIFYFADTLENVIRAHAFDPVEGVFGPARTYLANFARGLPDGSAVDSAGYLWNARYGGGCVVRVAPSGEVDRVVELPCGNVTTCTFGGPDLRTLFITTARGGAGQSERLAGSLFSLEAPVAGVPEMRFHIA